ncbi:MAG TPA: hypothetical protein VN445_05640 [Rectinemataceae bacterium]|nr:hypothetical protein [Rectinemataceae bacterium]
MKKLILAAILVAMMVSCSTTKTLVMQIDGIGRDAYPEERSYVFVPTDSALKASDLRFEKYTGYIEKALSRKGYRKVSKAEEANIIIYVMYGVGDPEQHQYAYSVPVFGPVPSRPLSPPPPPAPGSPPNPPIRSYSPTYGIIGSTTRYETYTTYFSYCKIEAFDLKLLRESGVEKQLWSTIITSTGSSNDLRYLMPYLISGAEDYIATDTGRAIEVQIDLEDEKTEAYY